MTGSETWADILTQSIFHTLIASLFVEALVRGLEGLLKKRNVSVVTGFGRLDGPNANHNTYVASFAIAART